MCGCNHGGKCTCALKREQVLEAVSAAGGLDAMAAKPIRRPATRPRRSMTAPSNGSLAVMTSHSLSKKAGVSKHRHQMSHSCGVPYPIPYRHHLHDRPDHLRMPIEERPATPASEVANSPAHEPLALTLALADRRQVRSEHGSPHLCMSPDVDRHDRGPLPPLDLSFSNFHPSATARSSSSVYDMAGATSAAGSGAWTPNSVVDPYFCATPDSERPMFSAGLDPPSVDWAAFDLPGPAGYTNIPSPSHGPRPTSYSSFDLNHVGGVGSVYAASTTASDTDDLGALGVPSPLHPPSLVFNHFPSDTSDACESESYRLSASSSSIRAVPQLSLLSSGNIDTMGIEEFLAGAATPMSPSDAVSEAGGVNAAVAFANYQAMHEPSKLAPTSVPAHEKRYSLPVATPADVMHSLWGPPPPPPPIMNDGSGVLRHLSTTPISLDSDGRGADTVWAS